MSSSAFSEADPVLEKLAAEANFRRQVKVKGECPAEATSEPPKKKRPGAGSSRDSTDEQRTHGDHTARALLNMPRNVS